MWSWKIAISLHIAVLFDLSLFYIDWRKKDIVSGIYRSTEHQKPKSFSILAHTHSPLLLTSIACERRKGANWLSIVSSPISIRNLVQTSSNKASPQCSSKSLKILLACLRLILPWGGSYQDPSWIYDWDLQIPRRRLRSSSDLPVISTPNSSTHSQVNIPFWSPTIKGKWEWACIFNKS